MQNHHYHSLIRILWKDYRYIIIYVILLKKHFLIDYASLSAKFVGEKPLEILHCFMDSACRVFELHERNSRWHPLPILALTIQRWDPHRNQPHLELLCWRNGPGKIAAACCTLFTVLVILRKPWGESEVKQRQLLCATDYDEHLVEYLRAKWRGCRIWYAAYSSRILFQKNDVFNVAFALHRLQGSQFHESLQFNSSH